MLPEFHGAFDGNYESLFTTKYMNWKQTECFDQNLLKWHVSGASLVARRWSNLLHYNQYRMALNNEQTQCTPHHGFHQPEHV